ncbi:MAG: 23S rRNA (adenine(2503)-C(2))-methyltransferase RlmN [Planctomycetes bacterium]|nr:23S rRNA (adenine(2503)-C(2))-methyltransferase RlmN [Planctomycetota bacterium]
MRHLLEQTPEQLQSWFADRGLPGYRASQVRRWLFARRADRFDRMSDLPKAVRGLLAEEFQVFTSRVAAHPQADDGTEKLLLELADRQRIECVLLRDDRRRRTICVSTQVGCGMGCAFCASGIGGVVRNLTAGEIVEQMLQLQRLLGNDERLSHIVVMGMGEPLANLDALLPALAAATDDDGLGIGARRITISTVGLPAGIRRLAEQNCQYHLAVSLHAADDALRSELVPANRKHGIAAVLAAADGYFAKTGRRVTFEYVLLAGVNDAPRHARQLVALLQGRRALVNVIPYNAVSDLPYRTPTSAATARFVDVLQQGDLNVKIRYRKGERIDAACGQLRRSAVVSP